MQITEGVYLIQVAPSHRHRTVNLYFIEDEKPTLIDAGYRDETSLKQVHQTLRSINYDVKDLAYIVNTHSHHDHTGGNEGLQKSSGAQIVAHPLEAEVILNPKKAWEKGLKDLQDLVKASGIPKHVELNVLKMRIEAEPSRVDVSISRSLEDGSVLNIGSTQLEVIHTPGHSPGHICLYDHSRRILFSGDHILLHTTPNIDNLRRFTDSLKKTLTYDVGLIAPGHEPIIKRPKFRIHELINHHIRREEAFYRLIRWRETSTLYELITDYWGYLSTRHLTLALREGYAHVEKLIDDGKVGVDKKGEIHYYTARNS